MDPHKYFYYKYINQRNLSRKRGHPLPNYSLDEFIQWLKDQPHLTELWENYLNSGKDRLLAPSIDRDDPNKPYTLNNISLITYQENIAKQGKDVQTGVHQVRQRRVQCWDLEGNFVAEYPSIIEAARSIGSYPANIEQAASGKRKTHRKMSWNYVE
ncbi:putative HNH homing endonuclease [Sulfitobacter phage vB_SupP_AX]|nr:putative HNH homing endonuclease [Sulfitobacter phage vB_SupP_AX]